MNWKVNLLSKIKVKTHFVDGHDVIIWPGILNNNDNNIDNTNNNLTWWGNSPLEASSPPTILSPPLDRVGLVMSTCFWCAFYVLHSVHQNNSLSSLFLFRKKTKQVWIQKPKQFWITAMYHFSTLNVLVFWKRLKYHFPYLDKGVAKALREKLLAEAAATRASRRAALMMGDEEGWLDLWGLGDLNRLTLGVEITPTSCTLVLYKITPFK